jgi:hypothetical protein
MACIEERMSGTEVGVKLPERGIAARRSRPVNWPDVHNPDLGNEVGTAMGDDRADAAVGATSDEVSLSHIDLRLSDHDIEGTLANAREVLERHLIGDGTLHDGRTVRQVFYDLTDIAIQALEDARSRLR